MNNYPELARFAENMRALDGLLLFCRRIAPEIPWTSRIERAELERDILRATELKLALEVAVLAGKEESLEQMSE